ncbi:MAG: retroviral-like aspartic protease family protein [Gammaproteobacteria bacterium]
MARIRDTFAAVLLALCAGTTATAADFDTEVPLTRATSGNFYIEGELNGNVSASFLVDTGSGLLTVSADLLAELERHGKVTRSGRMAARLANGRLQAVNLYRVERFVLGGHCDLGAVEVAVMPGARTNILGLNVLQRAAPFAVHVSPPKLALSACGLVAESLAAR